MFILSAIGWTSDALKLTVKSARIHVLLCSCVAIVVLVCAVASWLLWVALCL